jgi:hypothetical protein
MPLPLAPCADDITDDVCCRSVFDIADRIRFVATTAVEACFDPSCADQEWRSYVSVGPNVPEPLGDALIVHMPEMTPTFGSRTPGGNLLGVAVHQTRFEIMLTENGWPQIIANEFGEVIEIPDSAVINKIAMHAYSHGEKMYRAIVNGVQKNTLFPVSEFSNIGRVEVGGMRPRQPAAFTVGWTIPMSVQLTLP